MQFGLSESVAHWGRYSRDRRAVFANGKATSYGTLNADIDRIVLRLLDDPASRVAVACGSKYKLLVAILATLRAGKSVVLLNTGLSDEVLKINLADADVEVLLHDAPSDKVPNLVRQRCGRLTQHVWARRRSRGIASDPRRKGRVGSSLLLRHYRHPQSHRA